MSTTLVLRVEAHKFSPVIHNPLRRNHRNHVIPPPPPPHERAVADRSRSQCEHGSFVDYHAEDGGVEDGLHELEEGGADVSAEVRVFLVSVVKAILYE